MARRWVGRMWLLLVYNGSANSVDSRLQSVVMFKNKYWFRVVSVPGMHKTSGFRHRSHYQDPNRMATAVKWRHTASTASEDDEKTDTAEDEKTSAGLTTTAYFRRTWQRSMWFNGKIVACRIFEQDLSQTSHNNHFRLARHRRIQFLCCRAHLLTRFRRLVEIEFRFLRYFTDAWNKHQQDDFIFRNVYSLL